MTFVNYNIERNHAQKFGTSYFIFYHLHSIRNLQFTLLLSNQYLKSLLSHTSQFPTVIFF